MDCDSEGLKQRLVERLYGDQSEADPHQDELARHLTSCPDCREELAALRGVRRDLAAWREPEPRALWWAVAGARGSRRGVQRLAAAAVLLLALGAGFGLSGLSLHYENGPFRVALGRGRAAAGLEQLEERQRLQDEQLTAMRAVLAERPASRGDLLEQVRMMLAESEARQLAAMDAGWSEVVARAEAQRRYDLARVSAGLSYVDRRSGEHAARTTELVGYLLQASAER